MSAGPASSGQSLSQLTVSSSAWQSLGPLSVEVIPEAGDSVEEFALSSANTKHTLTLPPGRYAVIARRPNGEKLFRSVLLQGSSAELSFSDRLPLSPNEFMQLETNRGEVAFDSKRADQGKFGVVRGFTEQRIATLGAASEHLELKHLSASGRWTLRVWGRPGAIPPNPAEFSVEAGMSFLKVTVNSGCLAVGLVGENGIGPIVMTPPFRDPLHVTFPAECLQQPATPRYLNPSGQRAIVAIVTPGDSIIADLLTALGAPQVEHQEALWDQSWEAALKYVYMKFDDPAKALVGAHYLLRFLPDRLSLEWADRLCRIWPDVTDGPVIAGWLRLTSNAKGLKRIKAADLAKQANVMFASARTRPVTLFARTRRLLVDSAQLTRGRRRRSAEKTSPAPTDFLDYGAHAGGLEAFWGRDPFTPGDRNSSYGLASRDLGVFTLSGTTFVVDPPDPGPAVASAPVSQATAAVPAVLRETGTPAMGSIGNQAVDRRARGSMILDRDRFRKDVDETVGDRARVRKLVNDRRWREAEPDRTRAAMFAARTASIMQTPGEEAIVGDTNDLQAAWFLPAGATAREAVAYVESNNAGVWEAGSGFMISPDLFITNQHVIRDEAAARTTQITFSRETDDAGRPEPTTVFSLDPDRFARFSKAEELDYAIIAVGAKMSGAQSLAEFGYCVLSDHPDKHVLGMNVNIIQHPNAFPKMITVRNNLLTARTDRTLLYETDTLKGSSGSPVMNDAWEVVALHHYGEPFLEKTDDQGRSIPINVNEGVRISAIYRDLEAKLRQLSPAQQALLRATLDYSKQIPVGGGGRRLSPPHPSVNRAEALPLTTKETTMADSVDPQELRIVIPIEVSIRVGGTTSIAAAGPSAGVARELGAVAETPKTLKSAAEKLSIDRDYSNRNGYDPKFIPTLMLPLPTPVGKLVNQLAALRPGEVNAASGELKYEHFSIKMNKNKRIALFTATNIDGKTFLNVDRVSGEVTDGGEGETWYADPRISASFFLDQTFYSDWSNLFDRGHLTRRMDPDWGSKEEAERANADTYHFTNCSPQHFRFNESAKYWQGAEQYVLENGAIAEDSMNRICVFQGPIFDDKIDLWSDDVQIPSSFFKVIVWKGSNGARSVGLVVDQLELLSEQRKGGIKPKPAAFVNVNQWRLGIKAIETRTSLNFGDVVRDADTIKEEKQPTVGEAIVIIKSMDDLLPRPTST
jgi:endonuclease G, mitochondrial